MARSCACDRWLARAAADMGFQALPPGAQLLWFRLLAAAVVAEEKGHLRFPRSVPQSVSNPLNQSETEAAAHLDMLAELGWLEVDGDGRGVWMPGARAGTARAEAARINGLNGGRCRKGETKEQRRERRQGEMLMAVPDVRLETEAEPKDESSRAASLALEEKKQEQAARAGEALVPLGDALAAIAGMDPARGVFNYGPVRLWLGAGASAELLREVVRSVASRPSYPKGGPASLNYFDKAVREALERERAGASDDMRAPADDGLAKAWQAEAIRCTQAGLRAPSRQEFMAQHAAA